MQFKDGTNVYDANGQHLGSIARVVIDPKTKEVTDIVVRKGVLFTTDKVIPLDMIAGTSETQVTLRNPVDPDTLPDFQATYYVPLDDETIPDLYPATGYASPVYWYPPYGAPMFPYPQYTTRVEKNIPAGTIALKEGANVISEDNQHVGDVARVFTEPGSNTLTHFVVSQGLLFKEEKLIPINWVRETRENQVILSVPAKFLDRLPAFER